jgi:hypothetical protein
MAKTPTQIASLARSHTESAINCLVGIMNQSEAPPAARVSAASAILDRGWGKPAQPIDGDGEGGAVQLVHKIERVIVSPPNQDG